MTQRLIILVLVVISFSYSLLEIFTVIQLQFGSNATSLLWTGVFASIVALWANNDAKNKDIYKPYDYAYFIFLLWPFALPYHLIKIHGTDGLVMFFGFVFLYVLPYVTEMLTWVYLTRT